MESSNQLYQVARFSINFTATLKLCIQLLFHIIKLNLVNKSSTNYANQLETVILYFSCIIFFDEYTLILPVERGT